MDIRACTCGRPIHEDSTHCHECASDCRANSMPTPDEIAERAAVERAKWSKREMARQEGRTRPTVARCHSVPDDGSLMRKLPGVI